MTCAGSPPPAGRYACEVMTNVLYNLSRLSLGLPSLTPALIDQTFNPALGLFLPRARPEPRRSPPVTIAALSPLALPDLPEEIGRRLVEEHLTDPSRFWLPVPPPSVSAAEPSFSVADASRLGVPRYWRGPTWVNAAWLVWLGLIRLGYHEQAEELTRRLATAIATSGLREYYNPYTGAGMGAVDFGWSSLVLELLDPDPRAPHSYLPPAQDRPPIA